MSCCWYNADSYPSLPLEVPTWTSGSETEQTQQDLLHLTRDWNSSPAAEDDLLSSALALPWEEGVRINMRARTCYVWAWAFPPLSLLSSCCSRLKVCRRARLLRRVLCGAAALCGACEPDLLLCCNRRLCVGASKPRFIWATWHIEDILMYRLARRVLRCFCLSRHPVVPVEFPSWPESCNIFIRQASAFCSVCFTVLMPRTYLCSYRPHFIFPPSNHIHTLAS